MRRFESSRPSQSNKALSVKALAVSLRRNPAASSYPMGFHKARRAVASMLPVVLPYSWKLGLAETFQSLCNCPARPVDTLDHIESAPGPSSDTDLEAITDGT
jgi:hypothetical protein